MTSNQEKIKELQKQIDMLKSNELYERIIAYMDKQGFDMHVEPLFWTDSEGYKSSCFSYDKDINSVVEAEMDNEFCREVQKVEWKNVVNYWKETKDKQ